MEYCSNIGTCGSERDDDDDSSSQNLINANINKSAYGKNCEQWDYKCFVIMPFGLKNEYSRGYIESNYIFNHIICPAVDIFENESGKKVKVFREVENPISGSVTRSMIEHIAHADICIVDITGLNPNVFFELGIRYSLKRINTILLKQKQTETPFDLNGCRCITYDCFEPTKASMDLSQFLISGDQGFVSNDSLVFETFPAMKVSIPGVLASTGELTSDLSWNEWWENVKRLISLLQDPIKNGRFLPDVIFGISNGGLLVADLLRQRIFTNAPILSLWADRQKSTALDNSEEDCPFFDNIYNKTIMELLKREFKGRKINIMLVDDLVFSCTTVKQASTFIKKELGNNCNILFTPLYCREQSNKDLESLEEMLPCGFKNEIGNNIFEISKQKYFEHLNTKKLLFPYGKTLNPDHV